MDKHKLSNKGFGFYITAAVLGIIAFFLAINTKKKKPALYTITCILIIIAAISFLVAAIISTDTIKPESNITPLPTYEPSIKPSTEEESSLKPDINENPEKFEYYDNINNYRNQYYNNRYY